jgi:hypothetical protein
VGNEILPYYDPIEDDLYFASDGGRGIGGFDLYRAHFDEVRNEWNEPINLGFPVNSAMDEYLLLPGTDLGMMMFFSNREGTDSTVTVYRVHLVEPKKRTDPNNNKMLGDIATLGGVAGEILAELENVPGQESSALAEAEEILAADATMNRSTSEITTVTILEQESGQIESRSAYQEILADALGYQAASDSLKDLATTARVKVRESEDPNDRWVWQKQIMVWEKKAANEEELADALFAMLEKERQTTASKPAVNAPEVIERQVAIDGEPGTQPRTSTIAETDYSAPINRFDILNKSPYSESSPIPVDVSLPKGVFYRIQIGAIGQPAEPGAFKGISPITAENIPDRGLIKYYAGKFSKYADAANALSRVRTMGFEDAFIVSWYNRNPVSTQKAKQLE